MKVGISTIAYNQTDSLVELIRTSHSSSHKVEMRIFLHSLIPDVRDICDEAEDKLDVIVHRLGRNAGVSTSWNNALIEMRDSGCDVSILTNDDVWFSPGDIEKIAQAAIAHPKAYAIFCAGFHVGYNVRINCHGMSCFAMQPIALETVGFFDENLFPAYNEDVDYSRRAKMAGLEPFIVPDTDVHHIGSAAIKKSSPLAGQNHITHGLNNNYWTTKWGCPVSEDPSIGFRVPFNNRHFHPFRITEEQRHSPYPPYNRSDRGVVRF